MNKLPPGCKVIHGQVVTKKRWRLIEAYEERRAYPGHPFYGTRGGTILDKPEVLAAYNAWVDDFKRFMLHGDEPQTKAAQRYGAGLSQAAPAVGHDVYAVDAGP